MSVTPNNISIYGSANMPEVDGSTVGGAVDFTKRIAFYDISATGALDVVSSSSSDTAVKIQVTGRDSTGAVQTPAAVTLTGTTALTSTFGGQQFERLLAGVITGGAIAGLSNPGGTAAVGDVAAMAHTALISNHVAQAGSAATSGTTPPLFALASGDGATIGGYTNAGLGLIIYIVSGTGAGQLRMISVQYSSGAYGTDIVAINRDWGTLPDTTSHYDIRAGFLFDISPNAVTAITRLFSTAAADVPGGSQKIFYEKGFVVNNNTSTALTGVQVEILSETPSLPSGALLDLALETGLNDSHTVTNRQTAPTSGNLVGSAFTTQPAFISIASPGNLPSGTAPNSAGAQGIWWRLTLPAGTATYKGSSILRTTGITT